MWQTKRTKFSHLLFVSQNPPHWFYGLSRALHTSELEKIWNIGKWKLSPCLCSLQWTTNAVFLIFQGQEIQSPWIRRTLVQFVNKGSAGCNITEGFLKLTQYLSWLNASLCFGERVESEVIVAYLHCSSLRMKRKLKFKFLKSKSRDNSLPQTNYVIGGANLTFPAVTWLIEIIGWMQISHH